MKRFKRKQKKLKEKQTARLIAESPLTCALDIWQARKEARAKAEYALDGAQPAILMASITYVDDESFVLPSGVATEPADALPPHEAHPLPAHRTPFPKPLM